MSTEVISGELFSLSHEDQNGVDMVSVSGDLDLAVTTQVHNFLGSLREKPGYNPVIIDISKMAFIDASGLRLLADYDRVCRGEERHVVVDNFAGPKRYDRLFEITGTSALLT